MQREIKFRAWVDSNKEMVSPYFFVNDENFITQYGSSKPSAVMQFTGLKDKNGVEIYEGDILSSTRYIGGHYLDTLTDKVVVSFHNYKWAIQPAKRNLLKPQPITELEDDCEVIGNIYENPEIIN